MRPHPVTPASQERVSEKWSETSEPDETDAESEETLLLRVALPILGTLGLLALTLLAAAITAFV